MNISFVKDIEANGESSLQTVQDLEHAAALFRASSSRDVEPVIKVRCKKEEEGREKRNKESSFRGCDR